MLRKLVLLGFLAAVLTCGTLLWGFFRFAWTPASVEQGEFVLDVAPGSTVSSVKAQLVASGFRMDHLAFRIWARVNRADRKLRVGEYRLKKSWSAKRLLDEILLGRVLLHRVVLKEGYNQFDVQKAFDEEGLFRAKDTKAKWKSLLTSKKYLDRMGVPEKLEHGVARNLEGFLFPETYSFQKYDSLEKLVGAMLTQFEQRALPIISEHEWGQTPAGVYRFLTLASIVEKESGHPEEQPLVASVFWNRLKKGMPLQSDPTTIYGLLPEFDGNLRRIHLTTWSPWNTYRIKELPVTPICNPGETALRAVLSPEPSNYLYFVGKGDGFHAFSETLVEHNANVRKYQLKLR